MATTWLLGLVLLGCQEDPQLTAEYQQSATQPALERPVTNPDTDPARTPQTTQHERRSAHYGQLIPSRLSPQLGQLALEQAVVNLIGQGIERNAQLPINAYRRTLLPELYEGIGYESVFLEQWSHIGTRGDLLLGELRSAYQHGLDAEPYHLDDLDRLETRVRSAEPLPAVEFTVEPSVIEALLSLALTLDPQLSDDQVLETLARMVVGVDGEYSFDTNLLESFETAVGRLEAALEQRVWFELVLTDAYLSYARDMRLGNLSRLTAEEIRQGGGTGQIIADRFRETFPAISLLSGSQFTEHLESLYPTHPQYSLLMASLARYRAIVEAGGWEQVAPRSLERGSTHSRVAQLKQRLAIEGFYQGPIDRQYDQALEEAVRSYQQSHQMEVTGEPHNMFWRSLNIPAEQRLAQIEITLERWRASRIENEPYYVFVNIPDFHAEVWRNGVREMRFKIVAGNNQQECDPDTHTMAYVNATPMFHAEIQYLVFNPYWYVPTRIRRDELDLELVENPAWLQENRYEVVLIEEIPRVRQLPGDDNALGMVKFMLPNPHNVYLHDTPMKQYFQYPIRAFSHGCMRIENPMNFAEHLLTNDGTWDPERIEAILESGMETTVHLEEPVPIFVEYYVVRVDDEDRTNFLADIYRYDRNRLTPPLEPEPCGLPEEGTGEGPQPLEAQPVVDWRDDGSAVIPDGTTIYPDGTIAYSEERLRLMAEAEPGAMTDPEGEVEPTSHQGTPSRAVTEDTEEILPFDQFERPVRDHGP